MAKLIVLSGVPGSGKSTFIANHKWEGPVVILSTDQIRQTLTGDAGCLDKDQIVWKYIYAILERPYVDATYIVDATNIVARRRKSYLAYRKNFESIELIYLDVDVETALKRNMYRNRHVPEKAIQDMARNAAENTNYLELVQAGYDKVTIINNR